MGRKKRWRRVLGWTVGILGSIVVLLLFVVGPLLLSSVAVNRRFQFPDPLLGKTPSDFSVAYESVFISSTPGIILRGWYLPGKGKKLAVVYCHGLNRSRVEMLPQAAFMHGLGASGLLFDLRHHGQSTGDKSTFGAAEKSDIAAAVQWIRKKEPHSRVILWGISMGAASAMLAAAEDPTVDAVICDSTFLSFRETVDHHFRLFFRLPTWPIADEIAALIQWRGDFDGDAVDIVEANRKLGARPVLFVAQSEDRRMPADYARQLYRESAGRVKRLLILNGRRHGRAYRDHEQEYQKAVIEFLEAAKLKLSY
ncbi:MAG TPA: alpha/beta hydrolase [Acidobacteriota bacterium]|jgi:pimeloyl-ACP methyl ester carboxylesterase